MILLTLSLALWSVAVYGLRVALFGNPLHACVASAAPELISRADQVAAEGRAPSNEYEAAFLQRFGRLGLLEFAVFLLEIVVLAYLLLTRQLMWLSGALLLKNLVAAGFSVAYAMHTNVDGVFHNLLQLPRWLVCADRVSSLLSAIGLLFALFYLNGLHFWK